MNQLYKIKLETLTPIHIGAGQEKDYVEGADFIRYDKKIHFLNTAKISNDYGVEMLCNAYLNPSSEGLKHRLQEKGNVEDYIKQTFEFESNVPLNNGIKSQIKNPISGVPLIPGSSLKGAIRSLIFAAMRSKNERDEGRVLGSLRTDDDFLRFIQISDSALNGVSYINTKIFNLIDNSGIFVGGWKHAPKRSDERFNENGFNTVYECISVNSTGMCSIAFNAQLFAKACGNRTPYYQEKRALLSNDIRGLFHLINLQTAQYIEKEIDFFKQFTNNETPYILDELVKIQDLLLKTKDEYCILRMSAGSGFHSITGDWQFDTHEIDGINSGGRGPSRGTYQRRDSAKSRKIAIDNGRFYPMGFVMLSMASDEVYESFLTRDRESINTKLKEIRDKEAESIRLLEHKKQQQAEKEQKFKIAGLITESEDLYLAGELQNAYELLQQAKVLDPENIGILESEKTIEEAINRNNEIQRLSQDLDTLKFSGNWGAAIDLAEKLNDMEPANKQWIDELSELRHQKNIMQAKTAGIDPVLEKCDGKDFKTLNGQISTYLKRGGVINPDDYDKIYEALVKSYRLIKRMKEKEEWLGDNVSKCKAWKRISNWLTDVNELNTLFIRFQKEQNL